MCSITIRRVCSDFIAVLIISVCSRKITTVTLTADSSLTVVVPRPTQPSIASGSVNEDQLQLRRQRQAWFILFVDKRVDVHEKLRNPSTVRFCSEVPSLRVVISSV